MNFLNHSLLSCFYYTQNLDSVSYYFSITSSSYPFMYCIPFLILISFFFCLLTPRSPLPQSAVHPPAFSHLILSSFHLHHALNLQFLKLCSSLLTNISLPLHFLSNLNLFGQDKLLSIKNFLFYTMLKFTIIFTTTISICVKTEFN